VSNFSTENDADLKEIIFFNDAEEKPIWIKVRFDVILA